MPTAWYWTAFGLALAPLLQCCLLPVDFLESLRPRGILLWFSIGSVIHVSLVAVLLYVDSGRRRGHLASLPFFLACGVAVFLILGALFAVYAPTV